MQSGTVAASTFFTQAEVGDLHISVCVQQQVVELEVSGRETSLEVSDSVFMCLYVRGARCCLPVYNLMVVEELESKNYAGCIKPEGENRGNIVLTASRRHSVSSRLETALSSTLGSYIVPLESPLVRTRLEAP